MRFEYYVVKAIDKNGALVRQKEFTDVVAANGFATGLHAHFGHDVCMGFCQMRKSHFWSLL